MSCKVNLGLIPVSCHDIPVGGSTGRFWLIPKEHLEHALVTNGADGEITNIEPLSLGVDDFFSYRFQIPHTGIQTGCNYVSNNGVSGVRHMFTALISDMSMDQKLSLSSLLWRSRVAVIVETMAGDDSEDSKNPAYILFGEQSGLEMVNTENNLNDQQKGMGIEIVLATSGRLEKNFPINVIMTTAEIEALEAISGYGFPLTFDNFRFV